VALHRGEHRHLGQLRVLRLAPAPRGRSRRDGSRLERRVRARVSRRGAAAHHQPPLDPPAALVRLVRRGPGVAALVPERGDLVGRVRDPALPSRARAAGPQRSGRRASGRPAGLFVHAARADGS
jgi:hypothetical protein